MDVKKGRVMIDILSINKGDIVEYENYCCSDSLKNERSFGIYQDFMFWSPDDRPVELWVNFIGKDGMKMFVRASQIINVFRGENASI